MRTPKERGSLRSLGRFPGGGPQDSGVKVVPLADGSGQFEGGGEETESSEGLPNSCTEDKITAAYGALGESSWPCPDS